jgi:serine protease Do
VLAGLAQAQQRKSSPAVLAAFKPVVAGPAESTVRVLCGGKETALGTVVGADGWILTKGSLLKGRTVCRLKDGKEFQAKLVGLDDNYDLALLKIDARGLKPIQWRDSKEALVGNWVAAPGPGVEPVSIGVVSVASRKTTPRDLPPVQNTSGYLGILLEPVENGGVRIREVMPNSAAAKAGLKANDVIVRVADKLIDAPDTLMNTIQRFKPGESVVVRVQREDKEVDVKATLDKRPNDGRADFQNRLGSELSDRRGGFPSVLQNDMVIKPSDCGGPLVDLDSKAVGVNIARAGRVETYAVPSEAVQTLLPDLKSGKLAPPADLAESINNPMSPKEVLSKAKVTLAQAEKELEDAKKQLKEADASKNRTAKARARLAVSDAEEAVNEAKEAVAQAESEVRKAARK